MNEQGQQTPSGRIAVVGLGHVGAPLAVAWATSFAGEVEGVDRDAARLAQLGAGEGVERDVTPQLERVLEAGVLRLAASLSGLYEAIVVAIEPHDVQRLCELVQECVEHSADAGVVIIASTCRPEWFSYMAARFAEEGLGERVHLAHAPERMMPGQALDEVVGLPRVIGGYTPACGRKAASYYELFMRAETACVSLEEAALIKIAENAYRGINVVLANEIADVARRHGLDARQVIAHANTHPRVNVHQPGAGAWGRCLPLAMKLLADEGSALSRVANELNDARPGVYVERMMAALEGVSHPVVVVCGLAYKRELSDTRNSAGGHMIAALSSRGCQVRAVDPCVKGGALWTMEEALAGAHAALIVVAHEAFYAWTGEKMRRGMVAPAVIVDASGEIVPSDVQSPERGEIDPREL